MGAYESVDARPAPAPPNSNQAVVFVMRNGEYQAEHMMPIAPRDDTFNMEGGGLSRAPYMLSNPPDLKQTSLVRNPANVRKDTFELLADSQGTHRISFTFDASEACEISVRFLLVEEDVEDSETPLCLRPQDMTKGVTNSGILERNFPAGLDQKYVSEPLELERFGAERLKFNPESPRHVPMAVTLKVLPNSTEKDKRITMVSCQYTYVGLEKDLAGSWKAEILTQKLQFGKNRFELQEVFGIKPQQGGEKDGGDAEGGNNECVICMSEPRDTAVLPCRHLCFCNYCAGIVRLQCDRCPICRQKVSSLLQFKKDEETNPSGEVVKKSDAPKL